MSVHHPYPLDRTLPAAVFPQHWQRSAQYLNYPVFSWNWYVRRLFVFGPLSVFFGMALALTGLSTGDWGLFFQTMLRTVPAWVFIMLFGPALGTWVRHRDFGATKERRYLVLAILIGIAFSFVVKEWYEEYIFVRIRPALGGDDTASRPGFAVAREIRVIYDVLMMYIVLSAGGGRALINYFYELRRWQSHGHQQEMAAVKQQRDEADRRLMVLQAQVEPHFLYNTLASVRSLIRVEPERAEATIDALVDHLRATLPKLRDSTPTVGEQIEICRSYLEVMRIRTGGRLTYAIDVAPEIAGAHFPPLMLISIVENAVKHGVEPKPGPCTIRIDARSAPMASGPAIEVLVQDDGVGLREGPSEGVGLANIRAQLEARYGQRASLRLTGNQGGGVQVRLIVPIEAAP